MLQQVNVSTGNLFSNGTSTTATGSSGASTAATGSSGAGWLQWHLHCHRLHSLVQTGHSWWVFCFPCIGDWNPSYGGEPWLDLGVTIPNRQMEWIPEFCELSWFDDLRHPVVRQNPGWFWGKITKNPLY